MNLHPCLVVVADIAHFFDVAVKTRRGWWTCHILLVTCFRLSQKCVFILSYWVLSKCIKKCTNKIFRALAECFRIFCVPLYTDYLFDLHENFKKHLNEIQMQKIKFGVSVVICVWVIRHTYTNEQLEIWFSDSGDLKIL